MPNITVNGVKLHYLDKGEGPAMVLVHGFQSSGFAFAPVVDRLSERFRVLVLDLRGHGDSEKPLGLYTIQTFKEDVLAFIDALGLDQVDYMGQSMGGRTGTMFAIDHGDRLRRLLLVSSSASAPSGAYRAHFEGLLKIAKSDGLASIFDSDNYQSRVPKQLREGALAIEFRERFLKNTPETYASTGNALFTMPDLIPRLNEIKVPTWVCHGGDDEGPLAFSDVYNEGLPNARRVIIPGSGHHPVWDNTDL
ncbi:MAG: alpha/beta hydrolase, partial [Nitrospinaceae bacterium]|nr:alpha/beta hydrolase [Nitrospinaceae bacterium]